MTQGRRVQQNELVLFAGVGGCLGSIAAGRRIVAAVEFDPYCQQQIMARQEDGT
jgi:site-specific DNA-cytosine methylase